MGFYEITMARVYAPKKTHYLAGITGKVDAKQQPECEHYESRDTFLFVMYLRNKKDAENIVKNFRGFESG